jgi:hypothetical protein
VQRLARSSGMKMIFTRTVQQVVFLVLNSVPVTFVTNPELIRHFIPVMTHSLDQKVKARKAKARKCTAETVGNMQTKVERQHRLIKISFSVKLLKKIVAINEKVGILCT